MDVNTCEWLKVQNAALKDDPVSDEEIKLSVLEAQRLSVKLPVVRKVVDAVTVRDPEGKERSLEKSQTVICDVVSSVLASSTPSKYEIAYRIISLVPRIPS